MNFTQIRIDSETKGTVVMTPEHLYEISDYDIKYVIIYNLQFINSNEVIQTKIPYYISNEPDNKLGSNMLYPFMSNSNEVSNCTSNICTRTIGNPNTSILLKYNINDVMNIDKLEKDFLFLFFGLNPDLDEEIKKLITSLSNKHQPCDEIVYILQRMTNLLDFIICITSDIIIDFDYLNEIKAKENLFFEETTIDNYFRLVILAIFNKCYKLFVDNTIINRESIVLQPEIINVEMFNKNQNICDTETDQLNMKNYKNILNKIIDLITEKIDTNSDISERSKMVLKSLIIILTPIKDKEDEICNEVLTNWKNYCLCKGECIETKNVLTMNFEEICHEICRYSSLIGIPNINTEQIQNSELPIDVLRNQLLMIRSISIQYCYIGQLYIEYIISDNIEKTIVIDVDSSETISILKSKIYDIEGIDPSHQELNFQEIHLDNDRTILNYKIPNKSTLKLIIR